jgi:hypothetical protein
VTKQATKRWRQARATSAWPGRSSAVANASTHNHRDKPPPPPIPDAAARVAAVKATVQQRKDHHRG